MRGSHGQWIGMGVAIIGCVAVSQQTSGDVNLELRPPNQTVRVGNTASFGLYAVANLGVNEPVGQIQVVITWNPSYLTFSGLQNNGPYPWLFSGFRDDSAGDGINNTFADGDAVYEALAEFGGPATATPAGLLVATLQFTALTTISPTAVTLAPQLKNTVSFVLDALPPIGEDVTGTLGFANVTIICLNTVDCNDHNACTDDACTAQACSHVANDANNPQDGLFCNGEEDFCQGGMVVYITPPPDCDDLTVCTTDSCNEGTDQCEHVVVTGQCLIAGTCYPTGTFNPTNDCELCNSFANPMSWSFRGVGSACGSSGDTECDNPDSCNGVGTCLPNHAPNGQACADDGSACTEDECAAGVCAHPPLPAGLACGNAADTECTNPDTCDGLGTCAGNHAANGTVCNDGHFCSTSSSCQSGLCEGSGDACPGLVCDDFNDRCKGVSLVWSPLNQSVLVDGTVNLELFVVSVVGENLAFNSTGVILSWDSSRLELLGHVDNGTYAWVLSGFPNDCGLDGLNTPCAGLPANDGNAYYEAVGQFAPGDPAVASPAGLKITTLQFRALQHGPTTIEFVPDFGNFTQTLVLDAQVPGLDILTTIGAHAAVNVIQCTSAAQCTDALFCNGAELCQSNQCMAGVYPCGAQLCDEANNECVQCLNSTQCSDGVFCNGAEICSAGNCVPGLNPCPGSFCDEKGNVCVECLSDAHCNDGFACTVDSCMAGVCEHTPDDAPCQDGVFCNGSEVCDLDLGCRSLGNPCLDPVTCEEATDTCGGCEASTVIVEGSRYIQVIPPPGPDPVALWVLGAGPGVGCIALYIQEDGTMDLTPVFQTPAEWGVVHLHGFDIVPSGRYRVHTDCGIPTDPLFAAGGFAECWRYGDVNGSQTVDLDDLLLMFDAFTGQFASVTIENADIALCEPNHEIDLDDLLAILGAFVGSPSPCSEPCPALPGFGMPLLAALLAGGGFCLFRRRR